jgi:hypothetical protein
MLICIFVLLMVVVEKLDTPVTHLDPPVITVRNVTTRNIPPDVVQMLFASVGDSLQIERGDSSTVFIITRGPHKHRRDSWSDLKRIGGRT